MIAMLYVLFVASLLLLVYFLGVPVARETETEKKAEEFKHRMITWILLGGQVLFQVWYVITRSDNSHEMWWRLTIILWEVAIPIMTYLLLSWRLPKLAEKEKFFATVKVAKIIRIRTAEKSEGFYSNLSEGKYKDKNTGDKVLGPGHADNVTGEIVSGEDPNLKDNFWWKNFGVIWIGFGGSVYSYPFHKTVIDKDGKPKRLDLPAASIFLHNQFIVVVDGLMTTELYPIQMITQVVLETEHAGLSLDYDDWVSLIENRVRAACRDFVSRHSYQAVLEQQSETESQEEKKTELFRSVIRLNNNTDLNKDGKSEPGLPEEIGQRVVGFSVIKIFITDEKIRGVIESQDLEKRKQKAEIAAAETEMLKKEKAAQADLMVAKKEAEGIKAIGDARNDVLERTVKLINPKGAEELEKARLWSEGMKQHKGTLVLGGGTGILVGDKNEKDT